MPRRHIIFLRAARTAAGPGPRSHLSGHSLVEMLLVLALLGLCFAVGGVSLAQGIGAVQARGAAQAWQAAGTTAQIGAVWHGQHTTSASFPAVLPSLRTSLRGRRLPGDRRSGRQGLETSSAGARARALSSAFLPGQVILTPRALSTFKPQGQTTGLQCASKAAFQCGRAWRVCREELSGACQPQTAIADPSSSR